MSNIRVFHAYGRHAERTSEDSTFADVTFFVSDFVDWYHDCLKVAPKVSGRSQMTAYSTLPHQGFRSVVHRGVSGYLRQRGYFPNFRKARDFGAMNIMNSFVMPFPIKNPANKLMTGSFIPTSLRRTVRSAKVVRVFDDPSTVSVATLKPGSYFLKSNHGSQQNIHLDLRPGADPIDDDFLRREATRWLSKPFGKSSSQWWYEFMERKVFIEEDLREGDLGQPLEDLRFHCINGKVALLQLDIGLGTEERDNPVYDSDLNYMPYPFLRPNRREAPLPALAQVAKDAAEEIAKPFQYVRVDFYARNDQLFLGELTFLPNAGRRAVRHEALNAYLTSFWKPMPTVVRVA